MKALFAKFYRTIFRLQLTQIDLQQANASLDIAESERQIARIRGKISGNELVHSESLHARDLQLIAELIQIYNFIEFNLRRCIELFTHAGMIEKSDKTLPISRLSSVALSAISKAEGGEPWEAHLKKLSSTENGEMNLLTGLLAESLGRMHC